jgi:hypothetical protein
MLAQATQAACDFSRARPGNGAGQRQVEGQGEAHKVFRAVIQVILDQGFSGATKAFDGGSMGAMCMRLCQG